MISLVSSAKPMRREDTMAADLSFRYLSRYAVESGDRGSIDIERAQRAVAVEFSQAGRATFGRGERNNRTRIGDVGSEEHFVFDV